MFLHQRLYSGNLRARIGRSAARPSHRSAPLPDRGQPQYRFALRLGRAAAKPRCFSPYLQSPTDVRRGGHTVQPAHHQVF